MNLELRIPAEKCSRRVLEIILTKVQDENITVSEAFAQLLDQIVEREQTGTNTPQVNPASSHQDADASI